jgi:hypothetical protein
MWIVFRCMDALGPSNSLVAVAYCANKSLYTCSNIILLFSVYSSANTKQYYAKVSLAKVNFGAVL